MKRNLLKTHICIVMVAVLLMLNSSVIFAQTSSKEKVDVTIKTERQLRNFLDDVSRGNSYTGKVIKLAKDIQVDCNGTNTLTLHSAGNGKNIFAGTFDGSGHTISGIVAYDGNVKGTGFDGLFGSVAKSGTIMNLTIEKCNYASKDKSFAMIAGENYGTIKNCKIKDCKITCGMWASGVTGNNHGIIEDCTADVAITFGCYSVAGITTFNYGKILNCSFGGSFSDCAFTGTYYMEVQAIDIAAYNNGIIQNCFGYGKASLTNNKSAHYTITCFADKYKSIVRNCYYSEEVSDGAYRAFQGIIDNVQACTLEEMQSKTFVEKLNRTKGNSLAWMLNGEQEYPVHVDVNEVTFSLLDAKKGYVKSSCSYAANGDTVKLTTYLNKKYKLKKIVAKTASGKKVRLTKGKNGTYTFKMPNEKVIVTTSVVKK